MDEKPGKWLKAEEILCQLGNTKDKDEIVEILTSLLKNLQSWSLSSNWELTQNLINTSKHVLFNHNSYLIKRLALSLLANLAPVAEEKDPDTKFTSEMQSECMTIMKIFREFAHYFDPMVRFSALNSIYLLHKRGVKLDISFYTEFCEALSDDCEDCRITSIKLLHVLSRNFADCLVCVKGGDEQIRLVDDAFAKVCSMMNDLSVRVRVQAATLLGEFLNVSPDFLDQTLEKKLMSNLRVKRSAHERNRGNYKPSEYSSGRKWADDAPLQELDPEGVNLLEIGACGAFILGLEDEFLEIRMASLESVCKLALHVPDFGHASLDFIVDMFNDEIEDIRLKAIQCLSKVSSEGIVLREDQIDIVLGVLEDASVDIREALHEVLANCDFSTKLAFKSCLEKLLDNLRRYPEDKYSIWRCLKKLGSHDPSLTRALVPELLMIHPFLDLPEPSLENDNYISILMLVFNATAKSPEIANMFQNHTVKHYSYLRYSYPDLIPDIPTLDPGLEMARLSSQSAGEISEPAMKFLSAIFERIRNVMSSSTVSVETQTSVIELSIRDLERFGEIEPSMSYASDFLCQYLVCQMSLRRILSSNNWINAFLLSPLQSNSFRSSLQQILQTTFCLIHQFHGLHAHHLALIYQTRLKALALQLIAVIHGSNASALTLCDAFLEEVKILKNHLQTNAIYADPITKEMIDEVDQLISPKPGSVARALQPLFLSSEKLLIQTADLTELVLENTIGSLKHLRKTVARIDEPTSRSDNRLKFTAGFLLTLRLDATIKNIKDLNTIRLKIHYPDQLNDFIPPRLSDFRVINQNDSTDPDIHDYRLFTYIHPSHGAWTDPCHVSISIVADFRDVASSMGISQTWGYRTGSSVKIKPEDSLIIELCKPVRILILPKSVDVTPSGWP